MKQFTNLIFACVLMLGSSACHNDDYVSSRSTDDVEEQLETFKSGRVCLAYAPYYRTQLPNPNYVTHINYAFAEVYVVDGVYQGFKLQGDNNESRFSEVVALKKKNSRLKILLSFTHSVVNSDNSQGGSFSAIAASQDNRKRFAQDCLSFVRQWGIDGIDIDWEFPGMSWSGAACDPLVDVDNFTLLMQQLRETLGASYLLTFAGYVKDKQPATSGDGWRFIDLAAVMPYVDYVNIMTYDLDSNSFQSAVSKSSAYWDIERTRLAYLEAGVPYDKMVLGIPFYVRHSFDASPNVVDYYQIASYSADYKFDNWDDEAQTPYVTYKGNFWGSYDNAESIARKGATYVGTYGFKGMMYWDAGADDSQYTLSRACWNAVMKDY